MLIILQTVTQPVQAGKKSLMMGIALGAALRSRSDFGLLHVLIPLKMATDAWKLYGKHSHNRGHAFDHHSNYAGGYGGYRRR